MINSETCLFWYPLFLILYLGLNTFNCAAKLQSTVGTGEERDTSEMLWAILS